MIFILQDSSNNGIGSITLSLMICFSSIKLNAFPQLKQKLIGSRVLPQSSSVSKATYALLFFAQTYNDFLLVYIVSAIAASQQSGAFGTWFENNYKVSVEDKDPERKTFKFLQVDKPQLVT